MAANATIYDTEAYKFESEVLIVQVVFTAGNLRYLVHRKLLTDNSPMLKRLAALSVRSNPTTGNCLTVTLTGDRDEESYFKFYVNWLYSSAIKTTTLDPNAREGDPEFFTLAKSLLLGQQLEDRNFCDAVRFLIRKRDPSGPRSQRALAVRDKFITKIAANKAAFFTNRWVPDVVHVIYANTDAEDPARKLLVTIFANSASKQEISALRHSLPADFLADVAMELIGRKRATEDEVSLTTRNGNLFSPAPEADGQVDRKRRLSQMEQ